MGENAKVIIRSASNADCERVQALVFGVLREYGLEPDLRGTDRDIADIEAHYIARGGIFELIEDARGELLGTVGLYPITKETVELRKMYFSKRLRGRGFGSETLQRMIAAARVLGFKKIYLETASVLREAVHLYEKFGFQPTDEKHTPRCDAAYFLEL
ncbi:MAG TPA: GNAT family N-acetyltransferase [Pyrinomonadaceae bacterium]|jgi:putative acetyltransferase|nr:GNAT family N-acetyltransferase [Pyrinomonadaceae bacterium]